MKPLAIIIPVNRPEHGKSRLARVLSPVQRLALNRSMASATFDEAAELQDMADVYVVSKSADVRAQAALHGFLACEEPDDCDLNHAIGIGSRRAGAAGAQQLMVLPVDLPQLAHARLRRLVVETDASADVVIVTDRARSGTNVLLWRPAATVGFHYGPGSADRHADHATRAGLRVTRLQDDALSFDVDTPDDFEQWSGRDDARAMARRPLAARRMV